jgi:glutamine synthetase adenylyltransferase
VLPGAEALIARHRFLRRVSTALRLLGARPTDTLELAGPMPARVAAALGFASRDAFLTAYREATSAVREAYEDALNAERSHSASRAGHLRDEPASRTPLHSHSASRAGHLPDEPGSRTPLQ